MKDIFVIAKNYPWTEKEKFLNDEFEAIDNFIDRDFKLHILSERSGTKKRILPRAVSLHPESKFVSIFDAIHSVRIAPVFFYYLFKRIRLSSIFGVSFYSFLAIWVYFSRIYRVLKAEGVKPIIYTYWFNEKTYASVLLKDAGMVECVVTRAHGYDFYYERRNREFFPLRDSFILGIDRIYLLSKQALEYYEKRYPVRCPAIISSLGVHVDEWVPAYLYNDSPDAGETLSFITVAFYSKNKRIEFIFDCILSLALSKPDLSVIWTYVGAGKHKSRLGLYFHEECIRSGVSNLECKVLDDLGHEEIRKLYTKNKLDFFLLFSDSEGLPVSVMEAMSFGVVPITNNVGGLSCLVSSSHGAVIKHGEEKSRFCQEVQRLTALDRNSYRLNAHKYVKKYYNSAINYPDFYRAIAKI